MDGISSGGSAPYEGLVADITADLDEGSISGSDVTTYMCDENELTFWFTELTDPKADYIGMWFDSGFIYQDTPGEEVPFLLFALDDTYHINIAMLDESWMTWTMAISDDTWDGEDVTISLTSDNNGVNYAKIWFGNTPDSGNAHDMTSSDMRLYNTSYAEFCYLGYSDPFVRSYEPSYEGYWDDSCEDELPDGIAGVFHSADELSPEW